MGQLIILKRFPTRLEAEIAKGFLTAHKIQAYISEDQDGMSLSLKQNMAHKPKQSSRGVNLIVREEDEKKAAEILKSMKTH